MLSNSCQDDCFSRASLVTVISRAPLLRHTLHAKRRGIDPVVCVSDVHGRTAGVPEPTVVDRRNPKSSVRPQFNYEPFNSSSVNIRSWSWNYRGCWHQTCPPIVTRCLMGLNIPHCKLPSPQRGFGRPISFRCLIVSRHWAICAPAALRRSGSHFSGSLSGIEP